MTAGAVAEAAEALLPVYRPGGPVFIAGEGSWLVAEDGSRYLDFTSGIGVCALGHGAPVVREAITSALATGLVHVSNLFRTRPASELAAWLVDHSFAERVFFCNSGAEANEAAIKFARRRSGPERPEVIAFRGGFHGRTTGALALTDRPAIRDPFAPLLPGAHFCDVGDMAAVERLLAAGRVCAVIIEPVQGEGGIRPVSGPFLRGLRTLCDSYDALLVVDEVQTGLGRTGRLWAYEHVDVTPDLLTVAKPLAGGLPMGAVLLSDRAASAVRPGDHATTFGGGPVVAAAALAVCRTIGMPAFLAEVRRKCGVLGDGLRSIAARRSGVVEARGRGLMWGLEVAGDAADVVERARDLRLLLCPAGPSVARLLPPLTITDDEIAAALEIVEAAL